MQLEILKIKNIPRQNGTVRSELYDEATGTVYFRGTLTECHRAKRALEAIDRDKVLSSNITPSSRRLDLA
jgi:hypothetical protein